MKTPIINVDFPDVDIVRVGDVYYMLSTSMHFMPGCEIVRSYDLLHWEHVTYVFNRLDSTPAQKLEDGNIYGAGMWAACFRYHKGIFYICFAANDTHRMYLYEAHQPEGPWVRKPMEGFYHDSSLLFDDDGRVYIAYGNREIYITELREDLSGPKEGGLHRLVVKDSADALLGYEGTHFYKINGTYYLFFIHSGPEKWFRTEVCFYSDSLYGEFAGKEVFADDNEYRNSGIAQGAIVDTPDGDWYALLFQDRGGSGRMPYLIPMTWNGREPVLGNDGEMPQLEYEVSLCERNDTFVGSDDFREEFQEDSCYGFQNVWQFNHEPAMNLITRNLKEGTYSVTTDCICERPTQAKNSLTQRMCEPGCEAEITVDARGLKAGDYAGIMALQYLYGFIGICAKEDGYSIVYMEKPDAVTEDRITVLASTNGPVVRLKIQTEFTKDTDTAWFYYDIGDGYQKLPMARTMPFMLEHFTGYRFALTYFATKEAGGTASFGEFIYTKK